MEEDNLYFFKYGIGEKKLLLFHGFGQDHSVFNHYSESLSADFTVYTFDIYYHGRSTRANRDLDLIEWQKNFDSFLKSEQISSFSMLAFSLGGRFCLATLSSFADQIEHIILLAPDGIYQSVWHKIANTRSGNRLFAYLMKNEKVFEWWLAMIERSHLASHSMVKFARKELSTFKRREQVYQTWTYFYGLQLSTRELKHILGKYKGRLDVILGASDTIVPPPRISSKLSGIEQVTTHVIPARHNQIIDKAEELVSSLLFRG